LSAEGSLCRPNDVEWSGRRSKNFKRRASASRPGGGSLAAVYASPTEGRTDVEGGTARSFGKRAPPSLESKPDGGAAGDDHGHWSKKNFERGRRRYGARFPEDYVEWEGRSVHLWRGKGENLGPFQLMRGASPFVARIVLGPTAGKDRGPSCPQAPPSAFVAVQPARHFERTRAIGDCLDQYRPCLHVLDSSTWDPVQESDGDLPNDKSLRPRGPPRSHSRLSQVWVEASRERRPA